MDAPVLSYVVQKYTESSYALIQSASLPYESFSERSGTVVPALYPGPEAQLTDIITTPLVVQNLQGYAEVTCEPTIALRMTYDGFDAQGSDGCKGTFVYQYSNAGGDLPFSSFLDKAGTPLRTVQAGADAILPIAVGNFGPLLVTLTLIRKAVTGPQPRLIVNAEYSPAPGLWVNAQTGGPNALFDGVAVSIGLSIPASAVGFRCRIAMQYPTATQLAFLADFEVQSGTYRFPDVWSTLQSYSWPYLSNLPVTQAFRRICQDVLVTWTGSTLDNGGKIAIGLTPSTFCPSLAVTPYASVASLRTNRYDGPIKAGCHGTWRPGSIDDLKHMSVFTFERSMLKLVIGYDFAEASGSARLRTFGMFGYVSDNPIIGRMMWVPASTEAMREALDVYYQSFPACTNNKDHVFQKSFKRAAGGLGKGLKSLLERDDRIAAIAMMPGHQKVVSAVKVAKKVHKAIPKKAAKQPEKT